jgi:hypothetical protein
MLMTIKESNKWLRKNHYCVRVFDDDEMIYYESQLPTEKFYTNSEVGPNVICKRVDGLSTYKGEIIGYIAVYGPSDNKRLSNTIIHLF